eukprot:jgi/Botrbrau1/4199/Bobra.0044s0004.1
MDILHFLKHILDCSGCFGMTAEAANETTRILIPSLSVSRTTGRALVQAAAARATVSAYMLPQRLDPGDVIMWLLAVTILWGAAVWAGSDYLQETQASRPPGFGGESGSGLGSVFRIVMAAMFGIGCYNVDDGTYAASPAVGCPQFENRPGGWLLNDLLGASVLLLALRHMRLTSIKTVSESRVSKPGGRVTDILGARSLTKPGSDIGMNLGTQVATILLLLTFAYDIFWVILQPLILGGPSVMIEVATGGDSRIPIPFLLMMPHFFNSQMSILGFGDIVLPGLLVVYTRIFDLKHERKGMGVLFLPYSSCILCGLSADIHCAYPSDWRPAGAAGLDVACALHSWNGCAVGLETRRLVRNVEGIL